MLVTRAFILIVLVIILGSPASGQQTLEYSQSAEALFSQGLSLFTEGKFREAAYLFDRIIKDYSLNHRTTASFIMKGKALFRSTDYVEAARTLKSFLQAYPASSYVPDAEYTLGLIYLRVRLHDDATGMLISAWRHVRQLGSPHKLTDDILRTINNAIEEHGSVASVGRLLESAEDPIERSFFWLKIGEMEAERGNITAATIVADTLDLYYPGSRFTERVAALRSLVEKRRSVKIGALIPLMRRGESSAAKEIGTDIYEGILFALEEYNADPATKVSIILDTRDTEREVEAALRGAKELCDEKEIIALIGPLFSHTAVAVAGLADSMGVPLISPTANSNGIAGVGPFIFQANPDYETRGRAMARYAVVRKGMKKLAILAPSDTHGKFMADAFAAEAIRLDAKIVATEWYPKGTTDLKQQLANVRRAGMLEGAEPFVSFAGQLNQGDIARLAQLGVRLKTLDSLIERSSIVSAVELLGPDARHKIDSMGISALYSDPRIDSLEYPVTSIDGIYAPISLPEEIGVVSSQIVYFNFKAQLLGSGEWNSFSDLTANRRYCDGVVFESDNFFSSTDSRYVEFARRFVERYKKQPSKNTLYGYDTAMLLAKLVHNGATTRETMMRALFTVHEYQGLHSKIGLAIRRVNSWLRILRYAADNVVPIDELSVDEPVDNGPYGDEDED